MTSRDIPRLHPGYSFWWLGLMTGAFVTDLFDWSRLTAVFLLVGLVIEILAAIRRKAGDTLSEHWRKLLRAAPELIPVVMGWSVWIVFTVLRLLPKGRELTEGLPELGVLAFAIGAVVALPIHFLRRTP